MDESSKFKIAKKIDIVFDGQVGVATINTHGEFDTAVRRYAKEHGGIWNKSKKIWEIKYDPLTPSLWLKEIGARRDISIFFPGGGVIRAQKKWAGTQYDLSRWERAFLLACNEKKLGFGGKRQREENGCPYASYFCAPFPDHIAQWVVIVSERSIRMLGCTGYEVINSGARWGDETEGGVCRLISFPTKKEALDYERTFRDRVFWCLGLKSGNSHAPAVTTMVVSRSSLATSHPFVLTY